MGGLRLEPYNPGMAFQDEYIKTQVRLPRDLHAAIQLAAEDAGRSMNAEIIERLRRAAAEDAKESGIIDEFMALKDQAEAEQGKAVAAYEGFAARMAGVESRLAELIAKLDRRT